MSNSIRNLTLLGLFWVTATVSLSAGEPKPQSTPPKAAPAVLTGRIIFVDKTLRALAIDIKGQLLQINLLPHLKINKGGKLVSIQDLAAGQEVTVLFREAPEGRLDVVSLSIQGSPTPAETAGRLKPSKSEASKPQNAVPASPNPANAGGTVRSPNH